MSKRTLFIYIWMLVFMLCTEWILSLGMNFLEFIVTIQGHEDSSEIPWLNICYSASFYVSSGFMILGAVLGFKGWLPGTGFSKGNPLAAMGVTEAQCASKLLQIRREQITYFFLLKDRIKPLILIWILFFLSLFIAFINQSKWFAVFASGGLVGFLWRDWLDMFHIKVLWPFKMKITDWEKVKTIANQTQEKPK